MTNTIKNQPTYTILSPESYDEIRKNEDFFHEMKRRILLENHKYIVIGNNVKWYKCGSFGVSQITFTFPKTYRIQPTLFVEGGVYVFDEEFLKKNGRDDDCCTIL
jgi:hypothetical protein